MKILVVVGHYLPGYKGGGPIRSIANLIEKLGDEFQFCVVTSDRDLGDVQPYPGIERCEWQAIGKAQVLYLSPQQQSLVAWRRLLRTLEYDLIYLNGYFLRLSIQTLWLRKYSQIPNVPIVLAPRGEFSKGALGLKAYKKRLYLLLANLVDLCHNVIWHASSEYEAQDIRREILPPAWIITAGIPAVQIALDCAIPSSADTESVSLGKRRGDLRIVFLSRVSRTKNLDFALRLLQGVQGSIQFDIYGPLEDEVYWQECERLISSLPSQVAVRYCGVVPPDQVAQVFSRYHLFLFPTRGENFGHVILEALLAGCPVLLSDQTPWRELEQKGVGWDLPLSEPKQFQSVIGKCLEMDKSEFDKWAARARQYALNFLSEQETTLLQAYRRLFLGASN